MEKGKVIFFDIQRGFGRLVSPNFEGQQIFIHFSEISGEAKILLEDEEVEFEIVKGNKGLEAKSLKRLQERYVGVVETFDRGYGFIKVSGTEDKYFLHNTSIVGKGFKRIEIGYEVEFSHNLSNRRLEAKDVVVRDQRSPLEKFALFPNWEEAIVNLKNLAQEEEWDYISKKTGRYPVLENYLTYTFQRLQKEDKIKYATKIENNMEKKFACYNTGLATVTQEEIFAYFEHRENAKNAKKVQDGYIKQPLWVFKTFDKERFRMMNDFTEKPEIANYFQNASELIYDIGKRLIPDYEHIIDDNLSRFEVVPSFMQKSEQDKLDKLNTAIASAINRVKRNYKTAIPQFYSNDIQLLLPLCLENPGKADIALVVAREGEVYRANTVLPLDWAYNNARLLAKPDREWLNP